MPLYEYKCGKCDKSFEILQKNNNEKAVCPNCGGKSLEKLFSVFASASSSESSSNSGSIPSSAPGGCARGGCGCGMNMG
jgi:putative FmdB family regulatory protein